MLQGANWANPKKIAQDHLWKEHMHPPRALTGSQSGPFAPVPEQCNRPPPKNPEHLEPVFLSPNSTNCYLSKHT